MTASGDAESGQKIIVHIEADMEVLVQKYLPARRRDITTIKEALGKEDFDTIRLLGHSMKGNGPSYGFDPIGGIGARIEEGALARVPAEIRDGLDQLGSYLDRVEVVYE
ncbi:Hpt domain-containing protein [Planctomycetota bacterium]